MTTNLLWGPLPMLYLQRVRGCAGCHFNMAHLPRFDTRYYFNAEFTKRLYPVEEKSE